MATALDVSNINSLGSGCEEKQVMKPKKRFLRESVWQTKLTLIKLTYLDCVSHTSIHGVGNIFDAKNNWLIKIIWILCFLGSFGVCAWLIVEAVLEYNKHDVNSQIEVFRVNEGLEFPQIAICNLNLFASPTGAEFVLNQTRQKFGSNISSVSDLEAMGLTLTYQSFLPDLFSQTLLSSVSNTFRKSLGYSLKSMVLSCMFGSSTPCTSENDWRWVYDTNYGNCYQWNTGSPSIKFQTTASSGLTMLLYVGAPQTDPSKMMWTSSQTSGIYLSILNQTWYPYVNEGFNIKPGVCTDIRLSKTFVEDMPDPYSECQDIDSYDSIIIKELKALNITYRQTNCLDLCDQSYIIDTCGCYDFRRGSIYGVEPCVNSTQKTCLLNQAYDYLRRNVHAPGCYELCPIECESLSYGFSQSQASFPSRNYAAQLMETSATLKANFQSDNVTLNYENLIESLVCLNIYFTNLEYTEISTSPAFTLIDLISSVGGLLGLFLGMSLLSVIEIVELLMKVVFLLVERMVVDVERKIEDQKF